jgi:hypothetical protein
MACVMDILVAAPLELQIHHFAHKLLHMRIGSQSASGAGARNFHKTASTFMLTSLLQGTRQRLEVARRHSLPDSTHMPSKYVRAPEGAAYFCLACAPCTGGLRSCPMSHTPIQHDPCCGKHSHLRAPNAHMQRTSRSPIVMCVWCELLLGDVVLCQLAQSPTCRFRLRRHKRPRQLIALNWRSRVPMPLAVPRIKLLLGRRHHFPQ